MPRKRSEIVVYGLEAGLRGVAAGPAPISHVGVVAGADGRRIRDLAHGRLGGKAVDLLPGNRVCSPEHDVLDRGASHDGLVVVVAHRVLVGETLEDGRVA